MKTETQNTVEAGQADSITICCMIAALVKLDDCRAKCPGIGGDIDAANLRAMIHEGICDDMTTIAQASRILRSLSKSLNIDAVRECDALDALPVVSEACNNYERVKEALDKLVDWAWLRSDWAQAGLPEPKDHPLSNARDVLKSLKPS